MILALYQNTQGTQNYEDPNNNTVFVGGLDRNVIDDHLKQVISQYGQLVHVKILVEQSQYNGAGYYGYGLGYETYGYAPVAQDPAMYYGGYPGYGGYPQVQQQPQPQPQPQQHQIFWMIPGYSSELMPDIHEKKRLARIKKYTRITDSMTDKGRHESFVLVHEHATRDHGYSSTVSASSARQWHVHESEVVEVVADQYEDNTIDAAHIDDSKVGLQRVLETRKAVLQREQAMVYARALVAGLETDDLARVVTPHQGRMLEFHGIMQYQANDTIWMDEVASMQAYSLVHSTIIWKDQVEFQNMIMGKNLGSMSNGSVDGVTDSSTGMVVPPYYQGNLPWSPNVEDSKHRGTLSHMKGSQDDNFDSSDSSSESDLDIIPSITRPKFKERDIFEDNFKSAERTKDVLVDDPLAVQARSLSVLSDSQLRTQDVLMVSESNLNKKKDEATCINEPSDLYIVLERDTSCQETMAAWNPEMESESSNQKIVKLDFVADDKSTKSSTETLVGKGLERKGTIIEAKSNALFGSRSKKSTATKTTIPKGKSKKSTQRAFSGSNPDRIKKVSETQHGKVTIFRNEVQE
ncbi:COP1-interacting protein 7-like protein [Tanacetum coccineum]